MHPSCYALHPSQQTRPQTPNGINASKVINPPFIGQFTKTSEQTQDAKDVWGNEYDGYLDYVTCWYKKSVDYFGQTAGRFAFVSTNSIAQGQPVSALFRPIFNRGWRIRFAYQSFPWVTEAADGAAVHCVIIGFDRQEKTQAVLFSFPILGGSSVYSNAGNINAYLLDAPSIFAAKRMKPLSKELNDVVRGTQPTENGTLIVELENYSVVAADPIASKYLRPFRGSKELIHSLERWCLWMGDDDFDPSDIEASTVLKERVEACREWRSNQTKTGDAYKLKDIPHLFRGNKARPLVPYVAIPSVVSEKRPYFLSVHFSAKVIVSNLCFTTEDPDGFLFAIISSSMFITWQRAIGGALESRLRFSNTIVWNNLPLPPVAPELRQHIIAAGQAVLDARALHPEKSLAQHYEPGNLTPELQAAHDALDVLVDRAFGAEKPCQNNDERLPILFQRYIELTEAEQKEKEKAAAAKASKRRNTKRPPRAATSTPPSNNPQH